MHTPSRAAQLTTPAPARAQPPAGRERDAVDAAIRRPGCTSGERLPKVRLPFVTGCRGVRVSGGAAVGQVFAASFL